MMKLETIKELINAYDDLIDHAHWVDSVKMKDTSYNYLRHYNILSKAKKEVNEYASKNEF